MSVLLDTNVLIDQLTGNPQAREAIAKAVNPAISIITWIEVLAGATPVNLSRTRGLLRRFHLVQLSIEISESAVKIRRDYSLRLPDAIIVASALATGRKLITRDARLCRLIVPGLIVEALPGQT